MTSEASIIDSLRPAVEDHEFLSWLDIEIVSASPGKITLGLKADKRFMNVLGGGRGSIHGGILSTIIDVGGGMAIRTTFDDPRAASIVTTDLSISFVSPAQNDLLVEAEVIRSGRSVGFATAEVVDASDEGDPTTVAFGKGSFHVFSDSR